MRLLITEPAKVRLRNIHDYYKELVSPRIADRIKQGIIANLKTLRNNPFIGQKEELLEHLNLEHRRIVTGNYKIIYRIEGDTIIITDIFDARQNPEEMFG
jgi:plasmid stabilization system protein ParE